MLDFCYSLLEFRSAYLQVLKDATCWM
uniref:Uncharacterized protein n=1 Tax=Anguilla anguilla TaxID=7936 RepID=A0A0E9V3K5_ANGAN